MQPATQVRVGAGDTRAVLYTAMSICGSYARDYILVEAIAELGVALAANIEAGTVPAPA